MQVTATEDKAVHLTVKHAILKAARAVRKDCILTVFTDKRKSKHKSNIAGRQIKLWLMHESTAIFNAIENECTKYDCTAVLSTRKYNKYLYVLILRNN